MKRGGHWNQQPFGLYDTWALRHPGNMRQPERQPRSREEELRRQLGEMEADRDRYKAAAAEAQRELMQALGRLQQRGWPAPDSEIGRELGRLIARYHPDKGEQVSATDVVAELNRLRDRVKGKR